MTIGESIKAICNARGLPVARLEKDLGYSNGYVQGLLKSGRWPTGNRLREIANYLHVPVETLTGEEIKKPTVVNVLGKVAAGVPIEAIEQVIGTEEISAAMASTGEYFGLKIQGDSMAPEIKDGDVVIVRKQSDAETGDVVVAMVNGYDGACKRLKKYDRFVMLVSINPAYEPITSEDYPITVVGKVVEIRRSL